MNPGSPGAKSLGCTCDPIANNFGASYNYTNNSYQFLVDMSCPVHGGSKWVIPGYPSSNDSAAVTCLVYGKM